ncbi:MAG TPA: hypothetical protein VIX86_16905 [Streptosporangiaceae bacterium]
MTEAASRLVTGWTRWYTAGLPAPVRERRRAEISADIHGQFEDARSRGERPAVTAALMLSRLARGARHDLAWRHEIDRPARLARWQARRAGWTAVVLLLTLAAGVAWLGTGLSLRAGADRQPLRLAALAARQLATGSPPGSVLPPSIGLAASPGPFLMVFDRRYHLLASSGRLGSRAPVLPSGVFAWAAQHGQDRVTWEPQPGLREATVVEPYGGPHPGFVVAAQSLGSVSGLQLAFGWGIGGSLLVLIMISLLLARLLPTRTRPFRPVR